MAVDSTPNDIRSRALTRSEIVKTAGKFRTIVFTTATTSPDKESKLQSLNVEVVRVPKETENGRVSLRHVSSELYKRQLLSVLVEGGGEIHGGFLKEGLFDKIMLYYAPIIIGGRTAPHFVGGKGVDFLKDAYRIDITKVRRVKDDIFVEGYVHRNH